MADEYVTKTQAVSQIAQETGFGRRVIERTFDRLEAVGRIHVRKGPDARFLLISRADINIIIKELKMEED